MSLSSHRSPNQTPEDSFRSLFLAVTPSDTEWRFRYLNCGREMIPDDPALVLEGNPPKARRCRQTSWCFSCSSTKTRQVTRKTLGVLSRVGVTDASQVLSLVVSPRLEGSLSDQHQGVREKLNTLFKSPLFKRIVSGYIVSHEVIPHYNLHVLLIPTQMKRGILSEVRDLFATHFNSVDVVRGKGSLGSLLSYTSKGPTINRRSEDVYKNMTTGEMSEVVTFMGTPNLKMRSMGGLLRERKTGKPKGVPLRSRGSRIRSGPLSPIGVSPKADERLVGDSLNGIDRAQIRGTCVYDKTTGEILPLRSVKWRLK